MERWLAARRDSRWGRVCDGQGLTEYALIILLIAIACVTMLLMVPAPITAIFSRITASLQ